MMALSYSIETVIRGYHVYGAVWSARQGEVLYYDRELANPEDEFAVAVKLQDSSRTTMSHIPRELSRLAWHFIRRGGHITFKVTGKRERSPLPQGGLEIPCVAQFSVAPRNQLLLERLIEQFRTTTTL